MIALSILMLASPLSTLAAVSAERPAVHRAQRSDAGAGRAEAARRLAELESSLP